MMLLMVRQSAQLGDVRMFRGMLIPDQVHASCRLQTGNDSCYLLLHCHLVILLLMIPPVFDVGRMRDKYI